MRVARLLCGVPCRASGPLTEGQRADTHRSLVLLFGLLLVKTGKFDKKWGKFLHNLKDNREAGDYDALSFIDEQTAHRAVPEAEEFVAAVSDYIAKLNSRVSQS
jgi:uncharacterized protein (UPF0332 family)